MAQEARNQSGCSQSTDLATENDKAKGGEKISSLCPQIHFQNKDSLQRQINKHKSKSMF